MKAYARVDEAIAEMTSAMGLALTQWQIIEHALYNLYKFLYGKSDVDALDVSFGEMSLDIKVRAIGELIKLRTSDKSLHKSWVKLTEAYYKQKRLRDKLAHWTIMSGQNSDGTFYSYLSPPVTDPKSGKMLVDPEKVGALDARSLKDKAIKDFQFVAAAIQRYMNEFPDWS